MTLQRCARHPFLLPSRKDVTDSSSGPH